MISPDLCRAARAMLGMTAAELAVAAKIGSASIKRFESGMTVQAGTVAAIVDALQREGVTFLAAGQGSPGGGPGLRLNAR